MLRKKTHWKQFSAILLALFVISHMACKDPSRESSTGPVSASSASTPGLLERIEETGAIHAAYGVYPPYTQEDPNTQKVSGYCVDIINQIANELGVRVIWHRMNWNTMAADLQRGEFDIIADAVFQTIPRAREFSFTEPYTYFADGIAVTRKDDTRFTKFSDLDQRGVIVSVGMGWASETLVKARLSKPQILTVQTTTDLLQVYSAVISGRADVAITDGADAARFVKEHKDFKALWLDNPPAYMPAGFALRIDDRKGTEFMNVSLRNLRATGVLRSLALKHNIPSSDTAFPTTKE